MIDYETFCKIRDYHDRQGLTIAQTARALGLHPQTVAKWVRTTAQYRPRRSIPRASASTRSRARWCGFWNPTRIARSKSSSVCAKRARRAYHRQGLCAHSAPAAA
jgi:transposase-like protein